MKSICLFLTIFLASSNLIYGRQIVLDIPDSDIRIVENDVIDAEQWIRDAWTGKLNRCKDRIIKSEVEKSIQLKEAIPPGDAAIIQKAFNRPGYKSRRQREAN